MPFAHTHHTYNHQHQGISGFVWEYLHLANLGEKLDHQVSRLSKQTYAILMTHGLFVFAVTLTGFFFNIFLWRQSHSVQVLINYNLVRYINLLLGYTIVTFIGHKISTNRVTQIGLALKATGFSLIAFFASQASDWVWLFAIFNGLAAGIYWAVHHCLVYNTTQDSNRDLYYGLSSGIAKIISVFTPAIAGIIVSQTLINFHSSNQLANYQILFSLVILVFLLAIINAQYLPKVRFRKFKYSLLWENLKNPIWKVLGWREIVEGFNATYLAPILIYLIFKNEFDLGIFNSLVALTGAIVAIILGGKLKRQKRLEYGLWGAGLMVLARTVYVGMFSLGSLIFASLVKIVALPFYGVGLASTLFDAIDHCPNHKMHYFEHIYLREIFLTVGRVSEAALLLFLVTNFDQIVVVKYWYWIIGFTPLVYYWLTKKLVKIKFLS